MMKGVRLALITGCAVIFVSPAAAQDSAAGVSRAGSAADIVVTARRTEERLQDVPISMTVFNQEQIANRNIVSGTDLATYTPSLSADSRYGAETASYSIRGFTQANFTSPSVGTYFADVIGPRANGGTTAGNGAGVGQFFDLQNVQVLKGPQGTLFGRNTTGGAVLIVPQKPTDRLEGYVEGSIGNYDMRRIQAVLNVPLAETFKVRLGVDRQKRDGHLHNVSGIGPKDMDNVNYWAVRAAIVADITPDLENYIIGRYSRSKTNGTYGKVVGVNAPGCRDGVDPGQYPLPVPGGFGELIPGTVTTGVGTPSFLAPLACAGTFERMKDKGFWDVDNGNPNAFLDIMQWGLINTTTWQASDNLTIKNIVSYQQFRQKQSLNIGNDNYTAPEAWGYGPVPFTWISTNPVPGIANAEQATFTEELQIQGKTADGRFNYVVGGYFERATPLSPFQGIYSPITFTGTLTNAQDPSIPPGYGVGYLSTLTCTDIYSLNCSAINSLGAPGLPGMIQNSLTRYWYRNAGLFAQGTFNITEQLALTGGFRYTMDKVRAQGGTRQLFFGQGAMPPDQYFAVCAVDNTILASSGEDCIRTAVQKSNKPTWLVNLDYKPIDDVMLYAKYARGYRQGNVNASNTIPQAWGPEKVDSYEIGVKTSLRGALSGYFNLSAFYNDFSNQQLAANMLPAPGSTSSPAQAIVNAGKSRIQGVEVDTVLNYSWFGLGVGYTYLDTKLKSFVPIDFPGYLPLEPNTDVGWALPMSPKHKLTVTPSVTLPLDESVGTVTLSATYVHTAKMITGNSGTPYNTVPAYDLLNLNIAWRGIGGSPIDLSAFATNITKEKYYTFVGTGWSSTGVEYGMVGQPRLYGVSVRYNFGN